MPTGRANYSLYGNATTEGSFNSIWGYLGEHYDPTFNMYNFGDRWYDSGYGFFYGRDPLKTDISPYSYAGDSPLLYEDRTGDYGHWRAYRARKSSKLGVMHNLARTMLIG